MATDKYSRCIASVWTSAGAFFVTTGPAAFVGISALGSAAATTITIKDGTATASTKTIAIVPVAIAAGVFDGPTCPIVCTAGIVASNAGTVAGYCILYSTL